MVGPFWTPLVFSFIADMSGYSDAWFASVVLTLALTVPLLFLREGLEVRKA